MVNPYLQNFSILSQVLSDTSIFNLSASGAVNAINVKNTVLIIAQISLTGSSMMSVMILINKITPHAMMKRIGFMMFYFNDYLILKLLVSANAYLSLEPRNGCFISRVPPIQEDLLKIFMKNQKELETQTQNQVVKPQM